MITMETTNKLNQSSIIVIFKNEQNNFKIFFRNVLCKLFPLYVYPYVRDHVFNSLDTRDAICVLIVLACGVNLLSLVNLYMISCGLLFVLEHACLVTRPSDVLKL